MRNRGTISLIFLLASAFILFWIIRGRLVSHRDLDQILADERLIVLIESGQHGFSRDSAKVYGFQYEILRRFADEIAVELLVINEHGYNGGLNELNKGRCDVLVTLMPVVRDSLSDFVSLRPIISTRLMLVQKPDSMGIVPVRYQYQLHGESVYVKSGSPFTNRLNDLSEEVAALIDIVEVKSVSLDELVRKVYNEEINFTVCPEYLTARLARRYPGLDFSVPLSFRDELSWVVHKKSKQLHERLNEFLENFMISDDYAELYSRYFIFD